PDRRRSRESSPPHQRRRHRHSSARGAARLRRARPSATDGDADGAAGGAMSALSMALAQGRALAAATRGRESLATWRAVAAPWAVAHLLGLLVPVLVTWQLSTSTGFPGASELRAAF